MGHDTGAVLAGVREFIEQTFAGRYDLYDVSLRPVNRQLTLEVKIDCDTGVKVEDCETVSRALEEFLEATDLIHQHYTLEVSSPGVERLLKRPVDYTRQLGRLVRWTLQPEGDQPKEVFEGRLQAFADGRATVLTATGTRDIPLERVREARVVFEFPAKTKQRG
ncbi:MAG TPA: ribosome maturation factor RimP [Candidatus Ozemobacteraceae bacterium]|nr:ribosome maturation factor RimP [Candidatus Ozemobacteraceae bacterium]